MKSDSRKCVERLKEEYGFGYGIPPLLEDYFIKVDGVVLHIPRAVHLVKPVPPATSLVDILVSKPEKGEGVPLGVPLMVMMGGREEVKIYIGSFDASLEPLDPNGQKIIAVLNSCTKRRDAL